MARTRWSIAPGGRAHNIVLVHHRLGNLAEVFVDGESVARHGSAGDMDILSAADLRFDVDGHEVAVHIRERMFWGFDYGISVDGVQRRQDATTISSFEEHVRRSQIIGVLFLVFFFFPLFVATGRRWELTGIRGDYVGWGCLVLGIISGIRLYFSKPIGP